MGPGPEPGHRLEHGFGFGVCEAEVRGLGDFSFGVCHDDAATAAQLPSSRSSAWATVGSLAP
jgi:hypothetical protein